MKVNLSSSKANLSGSKVNLSCSKVNLSSVEVGSSGSKVNLSSMKVNLSSGEVNLSGMKVNLSSGEVGLSSGEVGSSGMKVNLSSMKVNLPKILISKSIVCGMCVMSSSDVSWGMNEKEDEFNDKTINNKVVLLGNSQVGKTQILNKKTNNEFDEDSQVTIGVGFNPLEVKIKQDDFEQNLKLRVFDTSIQEKFKSIILYYVKQAHAVVIVYDITNAQSFYGLNGWLNLAKDNANKDVVYFLVGNKTDMESERKVSKEEAVKFAEENKMIFFEVSAKTGNKIEDLFKAIVKACFKNAIKGVVEGVNNKINNTNTIEKGPKESEDNKKDMQIPTSSKNKRCNCCPCNKDEEE